MVEYPIVVYEERKYCVYVHVNKINGKKYVGITSKKKPEWRWGINGSNYKGTKHFYNSILKYGWEQFEHIIIYKNLSRIDASNIETILIQALNTNDSENGYNFQLGGYHGNHGVKVDVNKYGVNNPKSNKVICLNDNAIYDSQRIAAKHYNIKSGCWIGAACSGKSQYCGTDKDGNPLIWMFYSDYIRASQAEINAKLLSPILKTNSQQVICLTNGKIFKTIEEAKKYAGVQCGSGITRCCQSYSDAQTGHKRYHCGKDPKTGEALSWMYLSDYNILKERRR